MISGLKAADFEREQRGDSVSRPLNPFVPPERKIWSGFTVQRPTKMACCDLIVEKIRYLVVGKYRRYIFEQLSARPMMIFCLN